MASRDPKMDPNPNTHKENDPNSLSSPPPKASQSDPKSLTSTLSPRTNSGFPSFSQLLQGVMSANSGCPNPVQPVSPGPFVQNAGFEGAFSISHQEVLASVTARAAQAQAQSQPRATTVNSSTEKLTVAPSESTALKDALKVQTENRKVGSNDTPALLNSPPKALTLDVRSSSSIKIRSEEKHNSEMHDSDIIEPNDDIQKTPKSDEYSWRKYGQKQVKSSESSRSYYRCTQAGCHAKKKVQHLDESGVVIAVVYKGDHNHDPPQKTRLTSHRKRAKAEMIGNTDDSDAPKSRIETKRLLETRENEPRNSNSLVAATHTNAEKQHKRTPDRTPSAENRKVISFPDEKKRVSNVPNKVPTADVINENDGAPRKKRMIKEGGKAYPDASYKTVKDPKIIVHANGDGEIVSDGYKWRKYGQKMVKGNPYPRSYYRCTSAGCPVRKHVEKATNDSTAIIVTYEGKHDHDLPVPKKRHSSPNAAPLVSPTATTAKLNDTKSPSQEPSTDLSVEEKGNTDKVVESARTLLSIGIELKSC